MFNFSGLGVNWFVEVKGKIYDGRGHNEVMIDGVAQPSGPSAKGKYIGANFSDGGAFASADLTYCYNWKWCTQTQKWGDGFSKIDSTGAKTGWEMEPDPEIIKYTKGTQRYKMRFWWQGYTQSNFLPTCRALHNPVEFVYRSVGLVRGRHSYSIIADDLKKDEKVHLYQWTAVLGDGVFGANYPSLPQGSYVLAKSNTPANSKKDVQPSLIEPKPGDAMLLIVMLGINGGNAAITEPFVLEGQTFNRIRLDKSDIKVNYRLLLIPFTNGDKLPEVNYKNNEAQVKWADQTDVVKFTENSNRTSVLVYRDGKVVAQSK